jgi:hypothetical protein
MSINSSEKFAQYYQSSLVPIASGLTNGVSISGIYDNTSGLYPACDIVVRLIGKTSYEGRFIDVTIPKLYLPPARCFIGAYVYFDNPVPNPGSWTEYTQTFTTLNVRTVLQPSMYPDTSFYPALFAAAMSMAYSDISTLDTFIKSCNMYNVGHKSLIAPVNDGFEVQFTTDTAVLNILPYTLSI